MASVAPAGGLPPLRAMTARAAPVKAPVRVARAKPRAAMATARPAATRKAVARKAIARRAALHRARPRAVAAPTRTAGLGAVPVRRPTPMGVAAMQMAEPAVFALIKTTICETGGPPPVLAYAALGGPVIAPGAPGLIAPGPDGETPGDVFLPPLGPGPGPDDGYDGPIIIVPPGPNPPGPPVVEPPIVEPPPPTGAVPEPGTWALMLTGFGAVGIFLRRRKRSLGTGL